MIETTESRPQNSNQFPSLVHCKQNLVWIVFVLVEQTGCKIDIGSIDLCSCQFHIDQIKRHAV